MNRAILSGVVGFDPVLQQGKNERSFVQLTVGTKREYMGLKNTLWHSCLAFENMAQFISGNVKKNMNVLVEGEITYKQYKDKDGIDRLQPTILLNHIEIL